MIDYIWKASLILNGASCEIPFAKDDWAVEGVSDGGIKAVKLTKSFKTSSSDYWSAYSQAENEIDKFLNAAVSGMLFNANMNSFPTMSDLKLELQNRDEIMLAHHDMPTRVSFSFNFNFTLNEKSYDAILVNSATIQNSPNKDFINHCLHLFRQGLSYKDPSDKFFVLWRAFNAIYNHYRTNPRETEADSIKGALQRLSAKNLDLIEQEFSMVTSEEIKFMLLLERKNNLFDYLISASIVDDHGHDRSQELQQAVNSGVKAEIVKSVTFCAYALRCKYAHGSDQALMQNEKLFIAASFYLCILLSIFLNNLPNER